MADPADSRAIGRHGDVDPALETVVVGRDGTFLYIGLPERDPTDASSLRLPLRIEAGGLVATATLELHGWGGWIPGLIGYADDLAGSWQGWDGEKAWRDDSGAVAFAARHNRMNTVSLTVTLRPDFGAMLPGGWRSEIVVPIEPGVLGDLAAGVRSLFRAMPDA